MPTKPHPLIPAILAALLLAGCATNPPPATTPRPPAASGPVLPPSPPAPAPVPARPAPAAELKPAHITGSEEASAMLDNFTAFVAAVDGRPVAAGRAGWQTPLALQPGPHRLTVEFNRGVFFARADIDFTAASDATYRVQFASDAQVFGKSSYCEFWIADAATGRPLTPRVRAGLSKTPKAG
jgi:hypothetical protein